jgi:hypothetical protein
MLGTADDISDSNRGCMLVGVALSVCGDCNGGIARRLGDAPSTACGDWGAQADVSQVQTVAAGIDGVGVL